MYHGRVSAGRGCPRPIRWVRYYVSRSTETRTQEYRDGSERGISEAGIKEVEEHIHANDPVLRAVSAVLPDLIGFPGLLALTLLLLN